MRSVTTAAGTASVVTARWEFTEETAELREWGVRVVERRLRWPDHGDLKQLAKRADVRIAEAADDDGVVLIANLVGLLQLPDDTLCLLNATLDAHRAGIAYLKDSD